MKLFHCRGKYPGYRNLSSYTSIKLCVCLELIHVTGAPHTSSVHSNQTLHVMCLKADS